MGDIVIVSSLGLGHYGHTGIVARVEESGYWPYRVLFAGDTTEWQYGREELEIVSPAEEKPAEEDVVNKPSHYTQYPVEVIELTRHMSFGRGNSVKYISRAGFKGGPEKELEDLRKAAWYLQDEITQLEKKLEEAK